MRYVIALIFLLFSQLSFAGVIGPLTGIRTMPGPGAFAWAALQAFRGVYTPIGTALTIADALAELGAFDGFLGADSTPASRFPAQTGANKPLPCNTVGCPPGWTDSNTPPSGAAGHYTFTLDWGDPVGVHTMTGSTVSSICSQMQTYDNQSATEHQVTPNPYHDIQVSPDGLGCIWNKVLGGDDGTTYPLYACPDGYAPQTVNNQLQCLLNDANAVKWNSDGKPSACIGQDYSSYKWCDRDPDNGINAGQSTGGPLGGTGVDSYGNPVSESLTPNAAGGVDYIRNSQSQSITTGLPNVATDRFTTDAVGVVTSVTTNVVNNTTINNNNESPIDTSSLNQEATQQQVLQKMTATAADTKRSADELEKLNNPDVPPPPDTSSIEPGALSYTTPSITFQPQSGAMSGQCPQPYLLDFVLFSRSYHYQFDFSPACTALAQLSGFIMIGAYLAALRIIFA